MFLVYCICFFIAHFECLYYGTYLYGLTVWYVAHNVCSLYLCFVLLVLQCTVPLSAVSWLYGSRGTVGPTFLSYAILL